EIKQAIHAEVMKLYRQKEIEFPVKVGMASYMTDRAHPGHDGKRYDREGLFHWASQRFPGITDVITEEDFRTQSRQRLQELLLDVSGKYFPGLGHEAMAAKLAESFEGTSLSEAEDAKELAEWVRKELNLEVPEQALTGVDQERARQILWNASDERFRPEMR